MNLEYEHIYVCEWQRQKHARTLRYNVSTTPSIGVAFLDKRNNSNDTQIHICYTPAFAICFLVLFIQYTYMLYVEHCAQRNKCENTRIFYIRSYSLLNE